MKRGKGKIKLQRKRRRYRAKKVTKPIKQENLFQCIDGNMTYYPAAFCTHYCGYLTANMMLVHRCKKRRCKKLEMLSCNSKGKVISDSIQQLITKRQI